MIIFHLLLIAALSLVVSRAASYIARSVSGIARGVSLSGFLVSFGVLGFATSMPEISVAVFSAARGMPELSLGDLIGANIVILSLLVGLSAVISGKVRHNSLYRNGTLVLFLLDVLLPAAVLVDGRLTRADGMVLIAAHVGFMAHMYRVQKKDGRAFATHANSGKSLRRNAIIGIVAMSVLLVASYFLVSSAVLVAKELGISALIIGLMLFSVGTNVPETTFVLTESRRHNDVVLGDLFGSTLMNTPTLGLLALISPFTVPQYAAVMASCAFLTALVALFGMFMWTRRSLDRVEGWFLIAFYVAFIGYYAQFLS